jgi:hypothetical protein
VFFVVMIAALAAPHIYEQWRAKSWRAMGARRGLSWMDGVGLACVWGEMNGMTVRADAQVHGWGKHRHVVMTIEVEYPHAAPSGLLLTGEGLWAKAKKLVGAQDIQIGDEEFDRAFLIQGDDEAQVREFLRPKRVQQMLLQMSRAYPSIVYDRQGVRLELKTFWSGEKVEQALEVLSAKVAGMAQGSTYGVPEYVPEGATHLRGAGW